MLCTQCGHPNRPQYRICAICSAPLGGRSETPPDDDAAPTEGRVALVVGAIERLLTDETSPEAFTAFVDEMLDDLTKRYDALGSLEIPPLVGEAMCAEVEAGLEGLAWFCEGLARIRDFADNPHPVLLEEGLDLIETADARLQEALAFNRENRRRIEGASSDASTVA